MIECAPLLFPPGCVLRNALDTPLGALLISIKALQQLHQLFTALQAPSGYHKAVSEPFLKEEGDGVTGQDLPAAHELDTGDHRVFDLPLETGVACVYHAGGKKPNPASAAGKDSAFSGRCKGGTYAELERMTLRTLRRKIPRTRAIYRFLTPWHAVPESWFVAFVSA